MFGTAVSGRAKERPELAETPTPIEAALAAIPCRGAETLVEDLFRPLGYEVETMTPAAPASWTTDTSPS